MVREFLVQGLHIDVHAGQTLFQGFIGLQAIGEGHTKVSEYRGIAQIPLVARNGQLLSEMHEHGVGESEVPLGILEVNRVDLVGHGRRADLTLHVSLLEIPQGDVRPHISAEVKQDRVREAQCEGELGYSIMRLYLGGIRIPLDSKAFHEPLRYLNPVLLRVCDLMSVQVSYGPVELALGYNPLDFFYL